MGFRIVGLPMLGNHIVYSSSSLPVERANFPYD